MNNKPSVTKTWLPLIYATVISATLVSGAALAGNGSLPPPPQQGQMMQTAGVDSRFAPMLADLAQRFPHYSTERVVLIDATAQKMLLVERGRQVAEWTISTALKGLGSAKGSDQTPLGVHRVAQKFGAGAPLGTIFKSRQDSGQIAKILTGPNENSTGDNVTTRVLWLDGLEPGLNKGGNVDSHERFIYIHGTDEEGKLGRPASHGCIRMRNLDVVKLFDSVDENTLVVIAKSRG